MRGVWDYGACRVPQEAGFTRRRFVARSFSSGWPRPKTPDFKMRLV